MAPRIEECRSDQTNFVLPPPGVSMPQPAEPEFGPPAGYQALRRVSIDGPEKVPIATFFVNKTLIDSLPKSVTDGICKRTIGGGNALYFITDEAKSELVNVLNQRIASANVNSEAPLELSPQDFGVDEDVFQTMLAEPPTKIGLHYNPKDYGEIGELPVSENIVALMRAYLEDDSNEAFHLGEISDRTVYALKDIVPLLRLNSRLNEVAIELKGAGRTEEAKQVMSLVYQIGKIIEDAQKDDRWTTKKIVIVTVSATAGAFGLGYATFGVLAAFGHQHQPWYAQKIAKFNGWLARQVSKLKGGGGNGPAAGAGAAGGAGSASTTSSGAGGAAVVYVARVATEAASLAGAAAGKVAATASSPETQRAVRNTTVVGGLLALIAYIAFGQANVAASITVYQGGDERPDIFGHQGQGFQ